MAVISFAADTDHDWVVAGWHFRQVLDEAIARSSGDHSLVSALKLATEVGYLFVHDLEPGLAVRVTHAIRTAATEFLGPVNGDEYLDEELKARLQESMLKLLKAS